MQHLIERKRLRLLALVVATIAILGCSSDKAEKSAPADTTEVADKTETADNVEAPDTAKDEAGDNAEQSFAQAIALICEVPAQIPDMEKVDPAERPKLMADWIKERVTNEKALELFQKIASAEAAQKTSLLKAAAEEAGLQSCSLAQAVMPVTKGTVQTLTTDTPSAE
jgi:hypothetical protein